MNNIIDRINALREQMKLFGLHAFYISGTDPHLSEYVPDHWQSRSFISGFTGSAGLVVVTLDAAALWTDSRYFLQAENELRGTGIQLMKQRVEGTPTPAQWLGRKLKTGDKLGVDSACISIDQYRELKRELAGSGLEVCAAVDLLEPIWAERPQIPLNSIFEHDIKYAGKSRRQKLQEIRAEMLKQNADYILISALDDLAWTFNLRGSDVDYNPVFLGYAVVGTTETYLFVDDRKIDPKLKEVLENDEITLKPYDAINIVLHELKGTVLIDSSKTSQGLKNSFSDSSNLKSQISIPTVLKSLKNETELRNIRNTMKKDGAAMVEFLFWLNTILGVKKISEFDVAEKLKELRSRQEGFKGNSFFPIVGFKEHGAIVHYKVSKESAKTIFPESFLLVDSGGQYLDGTTDITRTIPLGELTEQQKRDFTLVLKGMIALTKAVFPQGTKGCNLDTLARKALWGEGLNYGHGTGHGIGFFLNVHEGPMSIRQEYNKHAISPGMVISNEPGMYREGEYGIRIENVIVCVEKETSGFGRFLAFDTLTLCPIDSKAIDLSLMTEDEINWLNEYHQQVYKELSPLLSNDIQDYLKEMTSSI